MNFKFCTCNFFEFPDLEVGKALCVAGLTAFTLLLFLFLLLLFAFVFACACACDFFLLLLLLVICFIFLLCFCFDFSFSFCFCFCFCFCFTGSKMERWQSTGMSWMFSEASAFNQEKTRSIHACLVCALLYFLFCFCFDFSFCFCFCFTGSKMER